jgi:L-lactate dehydrogenase complex protein LldG
MNSLTTSKARENILRKLRAGLERATLPMPFPEVEQERVESSFAHSTLSNEEAFASEFIRLGGKFVFCSDENELMQNLAALYDGEGWRKLLCSEPYLLRMFYDAHLDVIEPADPAITEADACITACEALVARTGSVLLSSKQPMGRVASVFYPIHIVVAYARQTVADLPEALALMKQRYGKDIPSMINLNTGPSRTADIEKTLVVGVHGPKEVYCFFVNR